MWNLEKDDTSELTKQKFSKTVFMGKETEAQMFDDYPQIKGFETWIEVSWVWNGLRTCKCDGLVSSIPKKGLQSLSLSENNRRSFWNICLGNLYDGWWSILNPYQQMILYHSTF